MTCQVIQLRPRRPKRRSLPFSGKLLAIAVPVAFAIGWLLALPGMPHTPRGADAGEHYRSEFAIAAGDLRSALEKYARQAGVRLSFDPASVSGLTTAGLSGRHTAADGLALLLRGTGYSGTLENGSYVLVPDVPVTARKKTPAGPRLIGALTPV